MKQDMKLSNINFSSKFWKRERYLTPVLIFVGIDDGHDLWVSGFCLRRFFFFFTF